MNRTRLAAGLAAAAATAAMLSACSTATDTKSDSAASSAAGSASASAQNGAAHNSEDVMFAQMMIPHHQQAVELGAMVPQHTNNADLIKLAGEIMKQQQPEINIMKTQLVQWGVNPDDPTGMHAGHMSGMVDEATLAKLKTLQGAEFDKLWLQSMISHHQGAIDMAQTEVSKGGNADMMALARDIITAQQTEIDQMKKMLAAAGG
jgi:uncharacterized protein (DUF305 family)